MTERPIIEACAKGSATMRIKKEENDERNIEEHAAAA